MNELLPIPMDGRECRSGRLIHGAVLYCVSENEPHYHVWQDAPAMSPVPPINPEIPLWTTERITEEFSLDEGEWVSVADHVARVAEITETQYRLGWAAGLAKGTEASERAEAEIRTQAIEDVLRVVGAVPRLDILDPPEPRFIVGFDEEGIWINRAETLAAIDALTEGRAT